MSTLIETAIGYAMGITGPVGLAILLLAIRKWRRQNRGWWLSLVVLIVCSLLWASVLFPSTFSSNGHNQEIREGMAWGLWASPILGFMILIAGFRVFRARDDVRGFEIVQSNVKK